ncbi:hypothetical protein EG832_20445, partial [bacterium]|nr:hypothetical protein [bacterium]
MKTKMLVLVGLLASIVLSACGGSASAPKALDLTKAVLKAEDLPSGFSLYTAEQMAAINLNEESLTESFAGVFKEAKLENFSVFSNNDAANPALIFSLIFYPLSQADIDKWNDELNDPAKLKEGFASGFGGSVDMNNAYKGIADGSAGFDTNTGGFNIGIISAR